MRLNIFSKMIGGFAIILVLMGIVGWLGMSAIASNLDSERKVL